MTKINMIAAHDSKLGIGKDNNLLWHIPEDMKHFKQTTIDSVVIMGRKTWDSLGKWKPLPNRVNIVVTRNKNFSCEADSVCHSLEDAIVVAKKFDKEIFIIGGGMLYKEGLKYTDKLFLTVVEGDYDADVFFPDYSDDFAVASSSVGIKSGEKYNYKFVELKRI